MHLLNRRQRNTVGRGMVDVFIEMMKKEES